MFEIGQKVKLKIDEHSTGVVLKVEGDKYIVFINGKDAVCYEDQLLPVIESDHVSEIDKDGFVIAYAAKKFSLSHSSSLFALNAGDIDFISFQYRPLRKILNAYRPRILIADEVGVGKTIEAGIIIKEFEKRESANKVLVVCPKELTYKWQNEMNMRFQESFRILSASDLDYCLHETKLDEWPRDFSRCIIGLEMIRRDEWLEKLQEITDPSHFDVLIVDEAHHVCNKGKGRNVISFLSDHSYAAVFLSATPLQLGSGDLFSLLNMLCPDEFVDKDTFMDMAEPNKYVNNAIRLIKARSDDWRNKAASELEQMINCNEWAYLVFKGNPIRQLWIKRLLDESYEFDNDRRVKCIDDLQSLNTFNSVINRTRRRDIAKTEAEFTTRDPVTIRTVFNNEEYALYKAVTGFKYAVLYAKYGPLVAALVMSTIERMITSSIHAFAENIDAFLNSTLSSFLGENYLDDMDNLDIDVSSFLNTDSIKSLADNLTSKDEKFNELVKVVEDSKKNGNGKLLAFSFFTKTIAYLKRRLSSLGFRVETITGATKPEDRKIIRDRFKLDKENPEAIDVLLCSEVGCEGLDYQFCSRMVNYDIPWNPMKIEQRIGRIDRYGQKSPKIKIYNFITSDTVEEKIFFRCFDRLGIFADTIGDLESVLGDITEELTTTAFDFNLSEEEKERRADEVARNIIESEKDIQKAVQDSHNLFLIDLPEEEKEAKKERPIVIALEMSLLTGYLKKKLPSADIQQDKHSLIINLRNKKSKEDFAGLINILYKKNHHKTIKQMKNVFELGGVEIKLCLDKEQLEGDAILLTPDSPLLLTAQKECSIDKIQYSFKTNSDSLPPGKYQYGVFIWKEKGYRESEDVRVVVVDKDDNISLLKTIEFEEMILNANVIESESFNAPSLLDSFMRNESIDRRNELVTYNTDLVNRKIKTFEAHYAKRIQQAQSQLYKTNDSKIKIMLNAEIQRLEKEREDMVADLSTKGKADVFFDLFAYGVLEVE